jgi:hypothetical protein
MKSEEEGHPRREKVGKRAGYKRERAVKEESGHAERMEDREGS